MNKCYLLLCNDSTTSLDAKTMEIMYPIQDDAIHHAVATFCFLWQ
ncbi:unnamed protein product [Acanthoscelides obtectus]|uniref:Uncharacterized protein n=1 Tax=Acanthoscelides obtectus TaxID=200917 RepID=A0A9P0K4D6_ACAOB|nr:unnamed protein product [Acanthoscelides obtectus]CAK1668830.1 hypothetical protein AOBTE_LOCUS26628 [Acanthoscelides obtectus]